MLDKPVNATCNFAANNLHIKYFVAVFFPTKVHFYTNKMLSYRRETVLQGALVLAESGRLEIGDTILRTL